MSLPSPRQRATSAPPQSLWSRHASPNQRFVSATTLVLAAAVLSALIISATPAIGGTPEPTPRVDYSSELDAALDDVVAAGVPGVIVRIKDPHFAARRYAAGADDLSTGTQLRSAARYRAGSITKTFVATIVLQLVGEGRIRLEERVANQLPGLLSNGHRITVRQLLNHTSGLPDYAEDPELFAGILKNRVWEPWELVAMADKHPQLFAPGSAWRYSNTNYIVAGLLIKAVTGHSLAHELKRRVFSPLQLDHTSFPVATAHVARYHAHGYISTETLPTADGQPLDVTGYNPSHAWAAGAIVSNAADLSHFYEALMSGRLLAQPLLREMKKTVAEDPTDPNTTFRYGLGIERVNDACGTNWGHSGKIFGYQTQVYWNAHTGRTTVIASTMFPAPAAAESPLATATDLALCGKAKT